MGDARAHAFVLTSKHIMHIETKYSHEQNHHKIMPEGEKTTP